MRKNKSTLILIIVFLVGLSVLLYPSISNYINQINATHAVQNYDQTINDLTDTDYDRLIADARAYNAGLVYKGQNYVDGNPEDKTYFSLLNVTGDGMMGYVSIRKLDVLLPIYHGTGEDILAHSTGHLEGSSLPVGGTGTHSIITGHRGLPAAKLFTDLDQLEIGDTFTITILDEVYTYQIDQILIVLPEEVSDLVIDPAADYVTLITCTPYAVNTHRMLVRGVRTSSPVEVRVPADAMRIDAMIVAPIVAAPLLIILLILLLVRPGRSRKKKMSVEDVRNVRKDGD